MKRQLDWLHAKINEIRMEHQTNVMNLPPMHKAAYIRRHWMQVHIQCTLLRKQFDQMVAAKHKEVVINA